MKKEGIAKETERNGHSQRRNPRDDFLETDGKINMHEGGVICFPRTVKLSLPIALLFPTVLPCDGTGVSSCTWRQLSQSVLCMLPIVASLEKHI